MQALWANPGTIVSRLGREPNSFHHLTEHVNTEYVFSSLLRIGPGVIESCGGKRRRNHAVHLGATSDTYGSSHAKQNSRSYSSAFGFYSTACKNLTNGSPCKYLTRSHLRLCRIRRSHLPAGTASRATINENIVAPLCTFHK